MDVYFDNEEIAEVASSNQPHSRHYRNLPKNVIQNFHKAIRYFQEAKTIQDVYTIKGLRYEKLVGNLKGKSSIRLNDQYRAILIEEADGIIIIAVTFEQISKHYE